MVSSVSRAKIKINLLDYSYVIINQNSHSKDWVLKHTSRLNINKCDNGNVSEYLEGGI